MLMIDDQKIFVEEVLDTWQGPDHRYFKLKGDDGKVYILRQDTAAGTWEMTTKPGN